MKRLAALVAVASMLVAAPVAAAKSTTYSGDIANGGSVEFTVKTMKKNGKKKSKVTDFQFEGLPVSCGKNGAGTTSGNVTFDVPVKKHRFGISAFIGNAKNPKSALDVAGKLAKRTATGTIRVHGSQVPLDNGAGTNKCDSATAHWSASK